MKKKSNYILLILIGLITSSLAQSKSFKSNFVDAFYDNAIVETTLRCSYKKSNKSFAESERIEIIESVRKDLGSLQTTYRLKNVMLMIEVSNGQFSAELAGNKVEVQIRKGNFPSLTYLDFNIPKENTKLKEIADLISIKDLDCRASRAPLNDLIKITNKTQHILIHPHPRYDPYFEVADVVSRNVDANPNTVILMDFPYLPRKTAKSFYDLTTKQNALPLKLYTETESYKLLTLEAPVESSFFVSQGGDNYYQLSLPVHEVIMSGGNFNYCMFINSKNLIESFITNSKTDTLSIVYLEDTLTIQKAAQNGAKKISIPRKAFKKTRSLSKIFNILGSNYRDEYLSNFLKYLKQHSKQYSKSFRSLSINFKSKAFEGFQTEVLSGESVEKGRDLVLNIEIR